MLRARQKRLAWLCVLVLALELALLCCASVHLADHACSGHRDCAICALVRDALRRFAVVVLAASALASAAAISLSARLPSRLALSDSLVLRRVRLND